MHKLKPGKRSSPESSGSEAPAAAKKRKGEDAAAAAAKSKADAAAAKAKADAAASKAKADAAAAKAKADADVPEGESDDELSQMVIKLCKDKNHKLHSLENENAKLKEKNAAMVMKMREERQRFSRCNADNITRLHRGDSVANRVSLATELSELMASRESVSI